MSQAIDLTGQRFGRLLVIGPTIYRSARSLIWRCECDCGSDLGASSTDLRRGHTRSCGCLGRGRPWAPRPHGPRGPNPNAAKDITGQRFGRLTAVRPTDARLGRYVVWHCVCDCGQVRDLSYNRLRYYRIPSCGCAIREKCKRERLLNDLQVRVIRRCASLSVSIRDLCALWDVGRSCIHRAQRSENYKHVGSITATIVASQGP